MARPLRIEYAGAFYHVTARGNERKNIFLSEADYEKCLANLADAGARFSVSSIAMFLWVITTISS
jgi:putative transposase